MHNSKVHAAVDSLRDNTFADTEAEHLAHSSLYHTLIEPQNGSGSDRYFVLNDLQSYYDAQKRVEDFYLDTAKWTEYALHNIAAMGKFSTDEAIQNYAKLIWDIKSCPVDRAELDKVRSEYSEHDKCRIL